MNKKNILILALTGAVGLAFKNKQHSLNYHDMEKTISIKDTQSNAHNISANSWFKSGVRLLYNSTTKSIVDSNSTKQSQSYFVFFKHVLYPKQKTEEAISFLPGFPTGSIDYYKIDELIEAQKPMNRIFVEYIGQGDSDKPDKYSYSTFERADLVEALWKKSETRSTSIVSFDYSSLVVMELLRRQEEKTKKGNAPYTIIKKVLLINGGYFIDGHSHPKMTTPLLKTSFGKSFTKMAQHSKFMFNMAAKDLWSKEYHISKNEMSEIRDAITRRNGAVFMHNAARFVDEHKANGQRLDLLSIYQGMKDSVEFHIVGSEKDQFEPKQVKLARERLGKYGVDIRVIPGGHMVTSEHPQLLTNIILELSK